MAVLTFLAVLIAQAALLVGPAQAAPSTGGQTELMFTQGPRYDTPLTQGTFTNDTFAQRTDSDYRPAASGCASPAKAAFAFVQSSSSPETTGSPERPAVTAGATVADLFEWPAPSDSSFFAFALKPGVEVGQSTDLVRLDERWPSGTAISIVAVCYTGSSDEPDEQVVVAGTDGFAITSWLQFTTTGSSTNPAKTSAGFTIGEVKVKPAVSLSGADEAGRVRLTAAVLSASGVPLIDATGRLDFYARGGAGRTLVGSSGVGSGGSGSVLVDLPPVGTEVVYEATFVPDGPGSATYETATSRRYAVLGPLERLPSEVTITAPDEVVYGEAAKVSATVRRSGVPASGDVEITVDAGATQVLRLSAGRVTLALPTGMGAGAHTLTARYAGTLSSLPAAASGSFTVAPASATLEAERKKRSKPGKAGKKGDRLPRTKLDVTVSGASVSVRPACTVKARVKGKLVGSDPLSADGTVVVKLKAFKAAKKRRKVLVEVSCTGDLNFSVPTETIKVRVPGRGPR